MLLYDKLTLIFTIMKNYLFLAACCMLATGFTACSDDDDNGNGGTPADTAPNVTETIGIQYPVTSISGNTNSTFNYSNGKMTDGTTDYTSNFVLTENPLTINISYNNGSYKEDTKITDIRTNANGFVTYAKYTSLWTDEEGPKQETWNAQIEYDADGHITKLTANGSEEGLSWTAIATYTWVNNNLTQNSISEEYNEDNYSEIYTSTYSYQYDKDASKNPNPGIFIVSMYDDSYTEDFMWYAGLLGKTTHNIPISVTEKNKGVENGEIVHEREEQKNISVTYNTNGSVASIEYTNADYGYSDTYIYGYGSERPSANLQSTITNLRTKVLKSPRMRHQRK